MKRRSFVKASLLTGSLTSVITSCSTAKNTQMSGNTNREFYELREYVLKNLTQQKVVEDYLQNAAIPALNRLGSNPVGVFTEMKPEGQTRIYMIIPYKSLDDYIQERDKLSNDANYLQAGNNYLNASPKEPAYERIEKSLLRAFTGMPQLKAPEKNERIFELRRYESPNEQAAKKKIEMFNTGGEMDIFRKAGLRAVFFGEMLFGTHMPNLTYMLTYNDMAEHDANWGKFGSDPEWKKLSSIAEYKDENIISKITATFLVPASYSQI